MPLHRALGLARLSKEVVPRAACRMLCTASRMSKERILRGIVFDMDGTLTQACIDFAEMRRRAGMLEGDMLQIVEDYPPDRRQKALAAIEEVEMEALDRMTLMPGLLDLCEWLDQHRIPRGLITRNSQASLDHFHAARFPPTAFHPALCRDFRPFKPSPAALQHICGEWRIPPSECMMVGDSPADDVASGNRAGAQTALLDVGGGDCGPAGELQGELEPTWRVASLAELQRILSSEYRLLPPGAS